MVGDKEPFYCETLTYAQNLKSAGASTHVDVYSTGLHAFDTLLPFRKISYQLIAAFEKQYLYIVQSVKKVEVQEALLPLNHRGDYCRSPRLLVRKSHRLSRWFSLYDSLSKVRIRSL